MDKPRRSLVLIVGAGASSEVGLPLGDGLKREIVRLFSFPLTTNDRYAGDSTLLSAFEFLDVPRDGFRTSSSRGVIVARSIAEGLPLSVSIDNYLDAHRDDEITVACGKLGIAAAILHAERKSKLFPLNTGDQRWKPDAAEGTWFEALFRLLVEGRQINEVGDSFSRVAIVCFNYDRCIEQFLVNALQWYYRVSSEAAGTLVDSLEIVRPYGSVGVLSTQSHDNSVPFGAQLSGRALLASAKRIRTFTEQTEDNTVSDRIQALLLQARCAVFLGFAFHRLNMRLLFPDQLRSLALKGESVVATGYGLSQNSRDLIQGEIAHALGIPSGDIFLRGDVKCADLFHEYGRLLERSWLGAQA
jgi:hypothetical protein